MAEWILVGVAVVGFAATFYTLTQARNRQRIEIEGYIRVDVGPQAGASGFSPPQQIAFIQSGDLEILGEADESNPMICVWYRNLQTHPLGVALGIVGKMTVELQTGEGSLSVVQTHDIAYIEPGKSVRIDAVRFPRAWTAAARIEAVQYRNLDWDGAIPRHGRRECTYRDGEFEMIPWSDPRSLLRDWLLRFVNKLTERRTV